MKALQRAFSCQPCGLFELHTLEELAPEEKKQYPFAET